MLKVKVYSTQTCPWCYKLKDWLKENKIKFEDIDVSKDNKAAQEMIKKSGQMGVPVTEIGNEIIMGFNVEKLKKILKIK
jgi:glutaredoxin-like YruB-family protein